MKLAIAHTAICRAMALGAGLRYLKEIGFDGVDYGFFSYARDAILFPADFRAQMHDVSALLNEIGLDCVQSHSPIPVSYGPATIHFGEALDLSNPHFADMVHALEASAILGRVQALHFHDFNTQDAHIVPGLGVTDWDKVAAALAEIGYEGDVSMEVNTHMTFPRALLPAALRFTAECGKAFVRKFEAAKAQLH